MDRGGISGACSQIQLNKYHFLQYSVGSILVRPEEGSLVHQVGSSGEPCEEGLYRHLIDVSDLAQLFRMFFFFSPVSACLKPVFENQTWGLLLRLLFHFSLIPNDRNALQQDNNEIIINIINTVWYDTVYLRSCILSFELQLNIWKILSPFERGGN